MSDNIVSEGDPAQPRAARRDTDALGPSDSSDSGSDVQGELPLSSDSDPPSERIEIDDEVALATWATKLDTTPQQLREAIANVGERAADVEMHLKGTHSTTNAERVLEADGA